MGIGFAIPSDMAKTVMDSIIKHGKVIRGWLGVSVQNLTPELAKPLGIKETAGALISGVESGSPADKAGLKRGDLVSEINGKKITDVTNLRNTIAATAPDSKVDFKVIRNGKELSITAILGEYREKKIVKKTEYDNMLKGVTIQEITPSLRDKLDLQEGLVGVVVTAVSSDSPAQGALQPNDVILEIDRKPIQSAREYDEIVSKIGNKDTVLLLINRSGGSAYLTLQP